jgi:hypothetical protein
MAKSKSPSMRQLEKVIRNTGPKMPKLPKIPGTNRRPSKSRTIA